MSLLLLTYASFISMWLLVFIALIFYRDGDDRRTLLLASGTVMALLSIFSMLLPTATISQFPITSYAISTNGVNTANIVIAPYNVTNVDNTLSVPEINLYVVFAAFLGFIFAIMAVWSFKRRLQYYTTAEFKAGLGHRR